MATDFINLLTEQPVQLADAPVAIDDLEVHGLRGTAPLEASGSTYPRPYANTSANSRSPYDLPEGTWVVRWQTPLTEGLNPSFVLHSASGIVLPGLMQWQLFDNDGTSLRVDASGLGQTIIDEAHGLFLMPSRSGSVEGRSLRDGERQFTLLTGVDDNYRLELLARKDGQLMVLSPEYQTAPHGSRYPTEAVLEVFDLGPTDAVDEVGLLRSSRVRARLVRDTSPLLYAALKGDTLVLAVQDQVYLSDWSLNLKTTLEAAFTPLSLSLDEQGRIYMTVRVEDEDGTLRRALWVLRPDGKRLLDVTLPAGDEDAYAPPIVGYDYSVYLFQGDHLIAISPEGDVRSWRMAGQVAGALALPDHRVLVAAGGMVVALDAEGEQSFVFHADEEAWITPPVLTAEGDVLVASAQHLYRLNLRP